MRSDAWVIHIALHPDETVSAEMLDLVMAGASLDLPLVVLFSGGGRDHLRGGWASRWRQLTDFGLARLAYQLEDDVVFRPEMPAEGLDATKVEMLLEHARGVLKL